VVRKIFQGERVKITGRSGGETFARYLKRLYKNAIPHSDTGSIIAFLSTANEDA
jgi:hypothetical protein